MLFVVVVFLCFFVVYCCCFSMFFVVYCRCFSMFFCCLLSLFFDVFLFLSWFYVFVVFLKFIFCGCFVFVDVLGLLLFIVVVFSCSMGFLGLY